MELIQPLLIGKETNRQPWWMPRCNHHTKLKCNRKSYNTWNSWKRLKSDGSGSKRIYKIQLIHLHSDVYRLFSVACTWIITTVQRSRKGIFHSIKKQQQRQLRWCEYNGIRGEKKIELTLIRVWWVHNFCAVFFNIFFYILRLRFR